jgi:ribosome-binding factor A
MKRQASIPNRSFRVADQVQRDLSELIAREVKDPRVGMVTIMRVDLTPDYSLAKIYFSQLLGDPRESEAVLNSKAGYLHSLLFKRMHIHTVPRLHFIFDDTTAKASDMNALIAKAVSSRVKDE